MSLMQEWADALRSGKYKQGRSVLQRGDTYCCLGVLCRLLADRGELREYVHKGEGFTIFFQDNDESSSFLPMSVVNRLQKETAAIVSTAGLVLYHNGSMMDYTAANDSGVPFSVIADHIEENIRRTS